MIIGSDANALTDRQVLEKYKDSLNWARSVSMQIAVKSEILELPDGNIPNTHSDIQLVYRRDGNDFEWIGKNSAFDANGKYLENSSLKIQDIFADGRYFTISPLQYGPEKIPHEAIITRDSNPYYQQRLEELRGIEMFGSPLFGRTYLNNRYSIADLLESDAKISIRPDMEQVRESSCYVLEATTKFGHITAWIAPDKAYNALKWKVEKGPNDFVGDNLAGSIVEKGTYEFELFDFQEINGIFIPKTASFTTGVKISGDGKNAGRYTYNISNVFLNPDFKTLKAFEPNVPEGTRVHSIESPGIKYIWKGGKAVPDVDGQTFEEIDKQIDQMKQQQ